ncbi:REP-associated tyrosine transposase [Terriglobus saanensis]|uniref:Transposase IS200-like domain-containing protein n=1 Tax=Terriglobus saanensis (strain ATCC BAA-1853 / DSM 23119 / SP1PR4) TaxID=401053 RepID=E8V294_TERSS|nr:transposase [Terriglobus saanensis]ADV81227.1 hypothetical protein AciPR4_0392 [Terriglobus saanensis SP1PR4]
MTRGLKRYQTSGHDHFLTFNCYGRRPYLSSDSACSLFEDALERMRIRYAFQVYGYVVMPEHVHLLVDEPKNGTLDEAIKGIKLSVTLRSRQRPFWLPRYHDFNIFTVTKFREKLRYLHRNPVVRGLVSEPEEWGASSYLHYLNGVRGRVEISSDWV